MLNTFGSCFLKLCLKPIRTSPWRAKKAFNKLLRLLYQWFRSCSQLCRPFLLVKPAGKDHMNLKPVWPLYVWVSTNIYIYIVYIYIHRYIYSIYSIYIHIYIYSIYISNWIMEYIHIYSYNYIFMHSKCKFNLICMEISELIIYCKYAWKF